MANELDSFTDAVANQFGVFRAKVYSWNASFERFVAKLGVLLLVSGVILIALSYSIPPEQGKTEISSSADVGDPFLEAAESVSIVEQVESYVVSLGDLHHEGRKAGRVLGAIQRSTFYLQVVLEAGGYLSQVLAKDYRNASGNVFSTASQIALVYGLELALGGGPTFLAIQVILNVAFSSGSWQFTSTPQFRSSQVLSAQEAFGEIPGFVPDQLWQLYQFVKQNTQSILLGVGIVVLIAGVILSVRPRG